MKTKGKSTWYEKCVRIVLRGFPLFANKTFANYWRKSGGYIGENPVNFRQLANVQRDNWRMSRETIGECPERQLANVHMSSPIIWRKSYEPSQILAKVHMTFANIGES
jgi:hypothetical protein